ncbi:MAG: YlmH/Sll1252 family protein [Clostridia bacterium]
MGLGIKREKLGDILLQEQGAVVFVSEDMASYIQEGVRLWARRCQGQQCRTGGSL